MRFTFLLAGLGLLVAMPLQAQPLIIPLSPQPQREPPPPPPPSPVPIAPAQGNADGSAAGQRSPNIVFNGTPGQQPGSSEAVAAGSGDTANAPGSTAPASR